MVVIEGTLGTQQPENEIPRNDTQYAIFCVGHIVILFFGTLAHKMHILVYVVLK